MGLLSFAVILCDLFRRYLCYEAELNYFYGSEFNCLYEYGSLLIFFCVVNKKALPYAVLLSSSELFLAPTMENSTASTATLSNLDLLANVVNTRKRFTPPADDEMDTDALLNTSSTVMPNAHQQKCRIIWNIMAKVKGEGIDVMCINDRVDVMSDVLGKLGLYGSFQKLKKPSRSGWNLTPLETRQKVWKF